LAQVFPDEVVQCKIEAAARCGRNAVVQQRLKVIGIVRRGLVRGEKLGDARDRFTVALDRSRLADPFELAASDALDRRAGDQLLPARNLKRMNERKLERRYRYRKACHNAVATAFNRTGRLPRTRPVGA